MKKLWNCAAVLLSLGICGAAAIAPVSAYTEDLTDTVYLYDEGEKLTDSEFQQVYSSLKEAAAETGMNLGVCIGSTPMGQSETIALCDDTYDALYGINTDGVFLYLDLSGEENLFDYISTSGKGQFYYTNSENDDRVSAIFDEMNPYLSRGNEDVPSAVDAFCDELEYYAEMGAPDYYYTYNSDNGKYLIMENNVIKEVDELPEEYTAVFSWGTIVLIALVMGLAAGGISLLVIWRRYQFKTAGDMRNYREQNKIRFTQRSDQFLRQYRTRTKISSDSSGGGGGGSSHSSSSGGSHGGGGNSR